MKMLLIAGELGKLLTGYLRHLSFNHGDDVLYDRYCIDAADAIRIISDTTVANGLE